jgi:hypothetical protein
VGASPNLLEGGVEQRGPQRAMRTEKVGFPRIYVIVSHRMVFDFGFEIEISNFESRFRFRFGAFRLGAFRQDLLACFFVLYLHCILD